MVNKKSTAKKKSGVKKPATSKKKVAVPKNTKSVKKKTIAKKTVVKKAKSVSKTKVKSKAKTAVKAKKAPTKTSKPAVKAKKATVKKVKKVAPKKPSPKSKTSAKKPVKDKSTSAVKKTKTAAVKKPPAPKPNKSLDAIVEKIRERLLENRGEVLKMLESSQAMERDVEGLTFSNEIDLASSLEGREMVFHLSSRDRKELKLIDGALIKIENKSYGYCESCEKMISLKRLQILPLTALCIECQESAEHR